MDGQQQRGLSAIRSQTRRMPSNANSSATARSATGSPGFIVFANPLLSPPVVLMTGHHLQSKWVRHRLEACKQLHHIDRECLLTAGRGDRECDRIHREHLARKI